MDNGELAKMYQVSLWDAICKKIKSAHV